MQVQVQVQDKDLRRIMEIEMNKEITSKGWIWFIRAWMTIPYVIGIPFVVAEVFYVDRNPISQPWFWISVTGLELLLVWQTIRRFRIYKLRGPSMTNLALLALIIILYSMIFFLMWTKLENHNLLSSQYVWRVGFLVTITPSCLFARFKPKVEPRQVTI